jgi:hypothetical protein
MKILRDPLYTIDVAVIQQLCTDRVSESTERGPIGRTSPGSERRRNLGTDRLGKVHADRY